MLAVSLLRNLVFFSLLKHPPSLLVRGNLCFFSICPISLFNLQFSPSPRSSPPFFQFFLCPLTCHSDPFRRSSRLVLSLRLVLLSWRTHLEAVSCNSLVTHPVISNLLLTAPSVCTAPPGSSVTDDKIVVIDNSVRFIRAKLIHHKVQLHPSVVFLKCVLSFCSSCLRVISR